MPLEFLKINLVKSQILCVYDCPSVDSLPVCDPSVTRGVTRWSDVVVTRGVTRGSDTGMTRGVTREVTRWSDTGSDAGSDARSDARSDAVVTRGSDARSHAV